MPRDAISEACARSVTAKYQLLAGEGFKISQKCRLFDRIVTSIYEEAERARLLILVSSEVVSDKLADFLVSCPYEKYSYQKHSATWSNFVFSAKEAKSEMDGKLLPDYNERTKEYYKDGFGKVFGEIEQEFYARKYRVEDNFPSQDQSEVLHFQTQRDARILSQTLARRACVKLEEYKIRAGSGYDEAKYLQDLENIKTTFKSANHAEIEEDWKSIVNEARDNINSGQPREKSWELDMEIQLPKKNKKQVSRSTTQTNTKTFLGDSPEHEKPSGDSLINQQTQLDSNDRSKHK